MLFIIPMVLLPNSLPDVWQKAEFAHEGNKSCSGSCNQAPLTTQEWLCSGIVMLRALVCLFPSVGNREKQREQGEKAGVVQKVPQTGGLKVGGICGGPLNAGYGPWLLLLGCEGAWRMPPHASHPGLQGTLSLLLRKASEHQIHHKS